MLGPLLALLLTTTHCTVVGENRDGILLTCDNAQRSELVIPISKWPSQWHGPELGFAYEVNAKGEPIISKPNLAALNQVRENSLREGRRWRRPAMQQQGNRNAQ